MNTSTAPGTGKRPRIVVLGDMEQGLRRLGNWAAIDAVAEVAVYTEVIAGQALLDAIGDADAVVLMRDRTPFGAELIAQLPKLRYVIFTGTRNTTLDQEALKARNIAVDHTEWGPSKASTCEMTWSLILAATRQLEPQTALLRKGQWRSTAPEPLADVLYGQTLGLIGLGEIGSRVAKVGQALGMNVITWSPNMTPERAAAQGVVAVHLETLLETSRVVSLHLVPSATTRHLMNAQRLARMRPDSLLVNTSRSALIDSAALAKALQAGTPAFAALDVFDVEPLPQADALRALPNVLLTPHLGFVSEPVYQRFAQGVVAHLERWLQVG